MFRSNKIRHELYQRQIILLENINTADNSFSLLKTAAQSKFTKPKNLGVFFISGFLAGFITPTFNKPNLYKKIYTLFSYIPFSTIISTAQYLQSNLSDETQNI